MNGMILASIFDSVIRNRNNVRIIILSNAVEDIEFSPLFTFFDLKLPYNSEIKTFKNGLILLHYVQNSEFRKQRKETLIRETYEKYTV